MIRKTQSIHFKHCDVCNVVDMSSPERCQEHASYIVTYCIHPHEYYVNELRSIYNIHYLFFIKQRVNENIFHLSSIIYIKSYQIIIQNIDLSILWLLQFYYYYYYVLLLLYYRLPFCLLYEIKSAN